MTPDLDSLGLNIFSVFSSLKFESLISMLFLLSEIWAYRAIDGYTRRAK
jgi:hypothetical protein